LWSANKKPVTIAILHFDGSHIAFIVSRVFFQFRAQIYLNYSILQFQKCTYLVYDIVLTTELNSLPHFCSVYKELVSQTTTIWWTNN
jgi:hypothetical protein